MSIEILTGTILRQMADMNKWQRDFFQHLLRLYLLLRGRYTFSGFSRFGKKDEHTYRSHAMSGFDFATFNRALILEHTAERRLMAFDPSHVSKSGKRTAGVGYFWSGSAGKAKWGLELCAFAAVDVGQNAALHYLAAQTIKEEGQALMDFYIALLQKQAENLKKMSKYLGVDAFFSKNNFVGAACQCGLHVISRLRDDAVLHGEPPAKVPGKKGRPKKYGGRIALKDPSGTGLPCVEDTDEHEIRGGKAWVKSLKRFVTVAIVYGKKGGGSFKKPKVYFCTDLGFDPGQIWAWYKSRFQIEFLFRDAKQHTGLDHCQSREQEALEYHFNMSLTAVSVAKVAHSLSIERDNRPPFSMANIKTQYFNELFVDRIFEVFANVPNIQKNNPAIQDLIQFGRIAA